MKLLVKILFIIPIVCISIITIYNALDKDIPKALGFLSVELAVISILFATLSIEISNKSDEKMKSLCTAFFMDISFIFEQNKNKIKAMPSSKIREYLIWQNRRLVLRAVQLKDWVKLDFQEDLVKYFISGKNSMIKGLRYKKSKLSNTEKTDIRCTYDLLKQLNLKNKNIERPSDLIDDEEKK